MFMFMMILLHALHTSSPSVSRRVVCAALATTAVTRISRTASAADPGMISVQKIEAGLAVLDDVVARWAELTTDCNYGEIRRELLETANKEALLKAATQTSKSETMVTMCKATGRLVREAIGADKSPLSGIDKVLETPALVARVAEDEFEILDGLFGDADADTSDANLIAENPSFYIDEGQLKERVTMAIKKLK